MMLDVALGVILGVALSCVVVVVAHFHYRRERRRLVAWALDYESFVSRNPAGVAPLN